MAQISASNSTKTFQLQRWLGLNESPDGDTGLKMGEAAVMRNFRITRESHLQIRPGYAAVCALADTPVRGIWSGYVNGQARLLAACGGKVWRIDTDTWEAVEIGEIDDSPVFFFGFSQKVYMLTGTEYYSWDGDTFGTVDGYIPVVATAVPPAGSGTLLERVNLLTGKKRAMFSPDGQAKTFTLPETDIDEVISVEGTSITWEQELIAGQVVFASAPEKGVNTITVTWRKGFGQRDRISKQRFAETYNGSTDTRVFLYGDGTNETVYSDLISGGAASAEYFPEMNVIAVDSANTPITAMIRHYDRLLIFKTDSAYSTYYNTMTLDDGTVTAAFYTSPLNREIGCAAMGQARLVQNNPRTLHGRAVYEWALAGNGARDERNAKRISDRVGNTLSAFSLEDCVSFDDEGRQEFYVVHGDQAVVHNYATDTWYYYNHFPATCMVNVAGEIYFGAPGGQIMHFSRRYRNDELEPIDAYWESGSMDFGQDWSRKYSANIWVSVKPENQSRVTVTAQSNRKSDYMEKVVSYGLANFSNVSFAHWSFNTNRKPQVQRVRLKVKKFTFYKLIFSSLSTSATSTILATDFQVRYTGNVK